MRRSIAPLLSWRFAVASAGGTLGALLVMGVPSAVIPNPIFTRMVPTETFNLVVWVASSVLIGLVLGTYLANPTRRSHGGHVGGGAPTTFGGVVAFLAVACPICNKVVVAALGMGGAMSIFAPAQPIIGAGSLALLAATLLWRVRRLNRPCTRCVEVGPV